MPNETFLRPREGNRFKFSGMKLNDAPDALPPDKYPYAQNVRGVGDDYVETRPGAVLKFTTASGVAITDIRAYAALFTDNVPRYLVRDTSDQIFLDNGVAVGSLAAGTAQGASMLPFRPGASPAPYMYIANGSDYQKFSAPNATNMVQQKKVGIIEPQGSSGAAQTLPAAVINSLSSAFITENPSAGWTNGGTAGAVSGTPVVRMNDAIVSAFQDPTNPGSQPTLWSLEVNPPAGQTYQQLMPIHIGSSTAPITIIQDVFPPLPTPVNISSIYYFNGVTGRCIVVPSNMGTFTPAPKGKKGATGVAPPKGSPTNNTRKAVNSPRAQSRNVYDTENFLSNLRRGSIIQLDSEPCLVWSVTEGPDGTVAIETSTVIQHFVGGVFLARRAISVYGQSFVVGQPIISGGISFAVTTGVGTETTPIASSPFVQSGNLFQDDDYITFGALIDNLDNLIELRMLIDVSDGTFTKDYYYYAVRPSDIQAAIDNLSTQLSGVQTADQRETIDEEAFAKLNPAQQQAVGYAPSAQMAPGSGSWAQIVANLNQLTRVGSDDTKSLMTASKIQFLVNCSAGVNVKISIVEVFGGQQPDVGDVGAPYQYAVRPRDSTTGVVGNPSPATRYGVSPRRQNVLVMLPAQVDPQQDTWDVFRYGGSVTEFRFIGSVTVGNSFTDNFDDEAAGSGELLDYDNFEPWPSVGLPNIGTGASTKGTVAIIPSTDPLTTSYLPGTLVRFGDQNVYTLWTRPVALGGGNFLFQFFESAGAQLTVPFQIQEPYLARQNLPYMWGPDASGTVFACGDPFRAGSCYFAKNYAPDNAPDSYNVEITPPTEPLLGGEILDGLGFVGSPERWWALYPQPDNPAQRYNFVQQPFPRGLAAPYGHCNDGRTVYWWAKDGIWSSSEGSLTDADLYSLFPHEGQVGRDSTYGTPPLSHTVKAPDYSRAGTFRLAYANYFLYATYQDSSGGHNCLVYDTRRKAWVNDVYATNDILQPTVFYHPEQQAGTLQTNTVLYDEVVLANSVGQVLTQKQYTNDSAGPITCLLATFEFDGGDVRGLVQWGDYFVDASLNSQAGLNCQPMSLGKPIGVAQNLAVQNTRFRQPVAVSVFPAAPVVSDFMGIYFSWTDDFTTQTNPTRLFVWQPSYIIQPAQTSAFQTFGASFQLQGYGHIRQIALAYVASQTVTLNIRSYDWLQTMTLTYPPVLGGGMGKILLPVPANKGQLFIFSFSSPGPFQVFADESEVHVGAWSRTGPYTIVQKFTDSPVAGAPI